MIKREQRDQTKNKYIYTYIHTYNYNARKMHNNVYWPLSLAMYLCSRINHVLDRSVHVSSLNH